MWCVKGRQSVEYFRTFEKNWFESFWKLLALFKKNILFFQKKNFDSYLNF